MKKLIIALLVALTLSAFSISFADEISTSVSTSESTSVSTSTSTSIYIEEKGNAASTTINNVKSKEQQIDNYTQKLGGDRTNGTVLYYLYLVQRYSIPVCFVGLVIASLNFFIIGNKKLDKREQGFNMLVTIIIGAIVFQVLPLLFTLIVANR